MSVYQEMSVINCKHSTLHLATWHLESGRYSAFYVSYIDWMVMKFNESQTEL